MVTCVRAVPCLVGVGPAVILQGATTVAADWWGCSCSLTLTLSHTLTLTQGFVDVDKATLQHTKYPNVFALGDSADASALPTSKTMGV